MNRLFVAEKLRALLPEACHHAPQDMATGCDVGTRLHSTGLPPPPAQANELMSAG